MHHIRQSFTVHAILRGFAVSFLAVNLQPPRRMTPCSCGEHKCVLSYSGWDDNDAYTREPCKFLSIVHEDGAGCSMQQSRSRARRFCTFISFAPRARVVTFAVHLRIKPCMCPHLSSAAHCFS